MLVLIQLLKTFQDKNSREAILSYCELIHDHNDPMDRYDFIASLRDTGVELTATQADMLMKCCVKGTYKAAFGLIAA